MTVETEVLGIEPKTRSRECHQQWVRKAIGNSTITTSRHPRAELPRLMGSRAQPEQPSRKQAHEGS